jgi:hypothetical protein
MSMPELKTGDPEQAGRTNRGGGWLDGAKRWTARVTGFVVLVASVSAWAQTVQETNPRCPSSPSTFPQLTYDEDDRYLSNPACRTELLDRLKFIPLFGADANSYLSFGAFLRVRGEYFSHPNWGSGPPGSAYLLQRYYLYMDVHFGERLRFFGELGSSLENSRIGGPRPGLDEDELDLHQGFLDLNVWRSSTNTLTVRFGREEMAFGSGNLISTRDGRNIRATFDGVRLTWLTGEWTVDGFAVKQTANYPGQFDDRPNAKVRFWGVYAVRPWPLVPHGHIDLYYLGRDNKDAPFDAEGIGQEHRETIGARLWGTTSQWDYNDEVTFQWGHFRSNDIRAWAVSTETGYRLDALFLRPRFGLRAVAFSGNHHPSGNTLGTFNSLNERGPYFSYAELFGRRNLIALQPILELYLGKTISVMPNAAFYWRESTQDGLYSAGGGIVVTGQKSNARSIGTHAAVQLRWELNRHVTFFAEYLHFFPGQFLRQSTAGQDIDYWTGWLEFRY